MVINIEEPTSRKQPWSHWFNIRIRQYMILEILFLISLIMIFYRLQTISNQNNQVIKMVSSMKSQMSILERRVVSGRPNENTKPLEHPISHVLKSKKMEQPINDLKKSKTEELITPPPLTLSNSNSNIPKKGLILNAADYLRGASVDNAHSSRSNLNPIIGYDQTNLVLLDRPQPPTHKAWCSNEHNPVLTINLAKYIKPISVSYQHSKWTHDIPMSTPRTYDVVACLDFYCQNWKPLVSNCEYSSLSIGTEQFCNIASHLNAPLIGKVQFRFKENYGDSTMTCVHLVRVYGETDKPVKVQKPKNLESEQLCNDLKYYYHNSYLKYNWDAVKLATHVCINAYTQGEEPGPKILPDSEYPEWLFKLDLRAPRELEDLDPDKDGWAYWRALRKRQIEQNQRIQKLKTRFLHLQNSPSMKKQ